MLFMQLREYITQIRRITITQAASEINVARTWLSPIVGGKAAASPKLARRIAKWSHGNVSEFELTFPERFQNLQ